MSTTTTSDLEVVIPEGADVEVVEVKGEPTEVEVNSPVKDLEVTISEKGEVSGKSLTKSEISIEGASDKEKVTLDLKSSFKKSDITVDKGQLDLTVTSPNFKKSTITGGGKSDSISFSKETKLVGSTLSLGTGKDSITFADGIELKGKTTVKTGKGKDIIEVGKVSGKGKLILSDFSKKDRLVVGGDTYKLADIKNGDAPNFIRLEA